MCQFFTSCNPVILSKESLNGRDVSEGRCLVAWKGGAGSLQAGKTSLWAAPLLILALSASIYGQEQQVEAPLRIGVRH